MGEGGRRHLWGGRLATAPSQSPRASAPGTRRPAQEPESLGAQSPEPTSERLSARPAPTLPQPGGAAGARARRRQARRRPAPRRVLRPRAPATRPRRPGLLLSATTPRTRRCLSRSLARLTRRPVPFAHPAPGCPPAAPTAEPRTRSRPGPEALPASGVRRPLPHLSPDPPLQGGSAGAVDLQPLPRNVPPNSGGGGNLPSFPRGGRPGPGAEAGARPRP